MTYKSKLNQIRLVLGLNVKLATAKLVDGETVVEAEEFVPGFDIFVVSGEDKQPAPDGEHTTDSGLKVKTEGGKIVSVEPAEEEKPKVEVEIEQAAEEKPAEEKKEEEMGYKDKVSMEEKIEEAMKKVALAMEPIVKDVAEMKSKIAKMEEKFEKFSKAPASGKISTFSETSNEPINEVDARIARLNELKNSFRK